MATLIIEGEENFNHIIRVLNTNLNGKQKVMFALTAIKGVGRRISNLVLKRANIDLNRRAGELTEEEMEKVVTIVQNPSKYDIPQWLLNRKWDPVDGESS
mmetsp:Transcript_767/g.93  ORF Transcript_767/g.93 Transcript_767/m.93 type:complete len:100 (-) Transcript_767:199-498(-)